MKHKTGDYLPLSYKTRLVVPEVNKEILKKYGIKSFILDSELLPQYDQIYNMKDGTEVVADTQLSLVTSILGSLDDLSHKIQETNPIKFTVFDIVMINGVWLDENNYNKTIETLKNLRDNMKITNEEFEAKERAYKEYFSCRNRIKTLEKVYTILKGAGLNNYIDRPKTTMVNKDDFYNNILAQGGEGVVAKDLNSLYETEGRRRGQWVKLKRSVSQSMMAENMGDTLDAFIIGFEKGNEGTSIENLISTLHFGIYLQDDEGNLLLDNEGNPKIHYIASVSGLSLALRETMTEIINGQVQLKQEYYNMVAEIDGQDISSKNLRFSHARLLRWRPDRSSDTCQIKYSFIKSLVM